MRGQADEDLRQERYQHADCSERVRTALAARFVHELAEGDGRGDLEESIAA